jgi:hypothetical protein
MRSRSFVATLLGVFVVLLLACGAQPVPVDVARADGSVDGPTDEFHSFSKRTARLGEAGSLTSAAPINRDGRLEKRWWKRPVSLPVSLPVKDTVSAAVKETSPATVEEGVETPKVAKELTQVAKEIAPAPGNRGFFGGWGWGGLSSWAKGRGWGWALRDVQEKPLKKEISNIGRLEKRWGGSSSSKDSKDKGPSMWDKIKSAAGKAKDFVVAGAKKLAGHAKNAWGKIKVR